jgi:hypothetical protein
MKRLMTLAFLCCSAGSLAEAPHWKSLGDGLEYATLPLQTTGAVGAPTLHVVRIDPSRVPIQFALASENGGARHTAAEWCRAKRFRVAVNAGMFAQDGHSNVGYLVAIDREGRLLFLFTRAGLSMHDLMEQILSTSLGVVRAMHVEGGPEASLSIHAGGVDLDLAGSYETGFFEDDTNGRQWELPNVLGVGTR